MNRSVRLMFPGRNPLARGIDRFAGALTFFVLALGLLLVPVMLTFGTLTYTGVVERAAKHAREWRQTDAVVIEDATAIGYGSRGGPAAASSRALVEWLLQDGATDTGRVHVEKGTRVGTRITIWLDERERPSPRPHGRRPQRPALCWS